MPSRIDTLTDAQRARMEPFAAEWIERARSCEPADRAAVEDGMRRCYEYAGVPWHGNVVWVDNPLTGAFAAPIAAHLLRNDPSVDGAVRGAVRDAVHVAVDGAVRVAVHDAVNDVVRGAVDDAVNGAVHGAVDDAVHDAVNGAVGGAVRSNWWRRLGGSWWLNWQAWQTFFRDECDLQLPGDTWDRLDAYTDAQSAGWWWPHEQFVIVVDRPAEIHTEQIAPAGWGSHRLHNDNGPAVKFRDDTWDVYSWHGLTVPAWVIEDPTPERIAHEENVEVRRAAIESFGWDRYVTAAGLEEIDRSPDPHQGVLYATPAGLFDEGANVLVVVNGTPNIDGTELRYGLTVPSDRRTVEEAQAWMAGASAPIVLARRT